MRLALRTFGDLRFIPIKQSGPLHVALGIKTHVHRQAILNDPRNKEWDYVTRVYSHHHLFRENITLAGA